jgi:hypothetical protein
MTTFGYLLLAAQIPLEFWIILWKIVLIGALLLFGGMAVWVTIGGFFDIKRLFRRIAESHEQQQEE